MKNVFRRLGTVAIAAIIGSNVAFLMEAFNGKFMEFHHFVNVAVIAVITLLLVQEQMKWRLKGITFSVLGFTLGVSMIETAGASFLPNGAITLVVIDTITLLMVIAFFFWKDHKKE